MERFAVTPCNDRILMSLGGSDKEPLVSTRRFDQYARNASGVSFYSLFFRSNIPNDIYVNMNNNKFVKIRTQLVIE